MSAEEPPKGVGPVQGWGHSRTSRRSSHTGWVGRWAALCRLVGGMVVHSTASNLQKVLHGDTNSSAFSGTCRQLGVGKVVEAEQNRQLSPFCLKPYAAMPPYCQLTQFWQDALVSLIHNKVQSTHIEKTHACVHTSSLQEEADKFR